MKYLITGLGNIGAEYANNRHNIGFMVLDALAGASNIVFKPARYGDISTLMVKGRTLLLLKPSTLMNRSGMAVRYWLRKEQIDIDRLLVISDDLALPPGTLRIRKKGGDGGHNGLRSINDLIGTQDYARLRFGIGKPEWVSDTADYVLSDFEGDDLKLLPECINKAIEIIKSFSIAGIDNTMNAYNNSRC